MPTHANAAVTQKIKSIPPTPTNKGPNIIAIAKDTPIDAPIVAIALVRDSSLVKSATNAITALAIAPLPCIARPIINPVIEKISEETDLRYEGCLSHPNLFLKVQRPVKLVTRFLDADAKECIIVLNNYDARVFLHEYDHLQGIEFTDRVSKLKLEMAKKKKTKREKRYING